MIYHYFSATSSVNPWWYKQTTNIFSFLLGLISETRPTRTVSLGSRPMAHIRGDAPRRRYVSLIFFWVRLCFFVLLVRLSFGLFPVSTFSAHSYSFVGRRVSCNFNGEESDEPPLPLTNDSKLLENRSLLPSPQLLTGHIGSELYAAPEVRPATSRRCRVVYDYKVHSIAGENFNTALCSVFSHSS